MSHLRLAASRAALAIIAGRRCRVCGPNTRSTNGARFDDALAFLARDAAADADDEVRLARASWSRQLPRWENTFSCAFSRTEQVFSRTHVRLCRIVRELVGRRISRSTSAIRAGVVFVHLAAVKVEM